MTAESRRLCSCGKVGWTDSQDADRAMRVLAGRERRKKASNGQLNVYSCTTSPELFHVGHLRSARS